MKNIFSKTALFFLISAFLFSCAGPKPRLIDPTFQAMDLNSKLQAGEYEQKIDNFYVISDRSGSKGKTYQRQMKFDIAYDFLSRMNSSIPDMELTSALRTFGASFNPFAKETHLIYGPTSYSKQGFQEALGSGYQQSGGLSPADEALDAANTDMMPFQGKTALIFVGDGQYKGTDPVAAVRGIKDNYGENVCVYPVLVGGGLPESVAKMKEMAEVGGCGFYQTARNLDSPQNLAGWVEAVFLAKVEKKAEVVPPPKPGDSDGDGVTDDIDQCPNTPMGAPVNDRGCWLIDNIYFDFDKSDLKPEFFASLVQIADVMKQNSDITVQIGGHTDNLGTEKYNEVLGDKRAMAAKQFLLDQGISEDRIATSSFGYSMPAATNETEWGRSENRRDEFKWSR